MCMTEFLPKQWTFKSRNHQNGISQDIMPISKRYIYLYPTEELKIKLSV